MRNVSLPFLTVLTMVVSLVPVTTIYALDDAARCQTAKLKEVGRYANCRMRAESSAVKKNTSPDYSKCEAKFADKWAKAESKAAGACPSNGDEAAVESAVASCLGDVAASLEPVPPCTGVDLGGACWFLSVIGEDCDATCTAQGLIYDEATLTYTGSDGSNGNCQAVMDALGAEGSGAPFENNACDNGYGCAAEFGDRHRCTDPATTSSATSGAIYRVCACAP